MSAKPSREHIDAMVAHVVATLPDSLKLRKTVLVTLLSVLPRGYEGRFKIAKLLEALRAHDLAQLKFHLGDEKGDGQ